MACSPAPHHPLCSCTPGLLTPCVPTLPVAYAPAPTVCGTAPFPRTPSLPTPYVPTPPMACAPASPTPRPPCLGTSILELFAVPQNCPAVSCLGQDPLCDLLDLMQNEKVRLFIKKLFRISRLQNQSVKPSAFSAWGLADLSAHA